MDVTSTVSTTTGTAAQSAQASAAATQDESTSKITSDFETFLRMLTTQMENQDPLEPMKSEQFAQQLATFSGVEQQVLTNDLLKELAGVMGTAGMTGLAGWVGMEVKGPVPLQFDGSPVTLYPSPADRADKAELVVRDTDGNEVQRLEIAVSDDPFEWDGVAEDGTTLEAGMYSFEVESFSGDEVIATTAAERYARVAEVQSQDGAVVLKMTDGAESDVGSITGMRDPVEEASAEA